MAWPPYQLAVSGHVEVAVIDCLGVDYRRWPARLRDRGSVEGVAQVLAFEIEEAQAIFLDVVDRRAQCRTLGRDVGIGGLGPFANRDIAHAEATTRATCLSRYWRYMKFGRAAAIR